MSRCCGTCGYWEIGTERGKTVTTCMFVGVRKYDHPACNGWKAPTEKQLDERKRLKRGGQNGEN